MKNAETVEISAFFMVAGGGLESNYSLYALIRIYTYISAIARIRHLRKPVTLAITTEGNMSILVKKGNI